MEEFKETSFNHMGREKNQFANALANLVSITKMDYEIGVQPLQIKARDALTYCPNLKEELDGHPWYHDIH